MKHILFALALFPFFCLAQEVTDNAKLIYQSEDFYKVEKHTKAKPKVLKPRNVILMIGDGMGVAQVYAGMVANKGKLYLNTMPVTGFMRTSSVDELITDSAAGATAFSTGKKTRNGAIGVDHYNIPRKTILELSVDRGLGTGLISTCGITHATPASFIAHQVNRNMYEEIAADFLKTDIDLFIGGARDHFNKRQDGRDLLAELKVKGYGIVNTIDSLEFAEAPRIAALINEEHPPTILDGRGDMLREASTFAIDKLQKNNKGFFLMIEGSQIDWGGHDNNVPYIVTEMLDFDQTLGEVLDFAAKDGRTLVIVTADHETGGLTINGGDMETGLIIGKFTTGGHTGIMVPVYAYGPKSELFSGTMENTDIYKKMMEALNW